MSGQTADRDVWLDRLSDYLDGELTRREHRACDEHVARCARCAALVAQLRQVAGRAGRMQVPVEPPRDLWPDIAERLASKEPDATAVRPPSLARAGGELRRGLAAAASAVERAAEAGPRRPIAWLRPQLAAAAAIVLVSAALVFWGLHTRSGQVQRAATRSSVLSTVADDAEHQYEQKVASLHREAHARLTLDPHLIDVLDENLATLDAAIAAYRDALEASPGDRQLRSRLDAARQKKLEVLQQAVELASEGAE